MSNAFSDCFNFCELCIFRGSRSEDRDYELENQDSDRLEEDYNWEYDNGDYDQYQYEYGQHNGYNQYGGEEEGNQTNDYHDGDYQWEHGVEERGESFWRTECRNWNAEEVRIIDLATSKFSFPLAGLSRG